MRCPFCDTPLVDVDNIADAIKKKCQNPECDFNKEVGIAFSNFSPRREDVTKLWDRIADYFELYENYLTQNSDITYYQARLALVNFLNISLKPTTTIIDFRPIKKSAQIDFSMRPCVSNINYEKGFDQIKKQSLYTEFISELIKFCAEKYEFDFANVNYLSTGKAFDCTEFIKGRVKGGDTTSYFSENVENLCSIIFLTIQDNHKNQALLTILLPFKDDQLAAVHASNDQNILKINNSLRKVSKHLRLEKNDLCNRYDMKCNCEYAIQYAEEDSLDVDKKEYFKIVTSMIEKLEEKMCGELGFNRRQIWTLKYIRKNNNPQDETGLGVFRFILPKEKKDLVKKQMISDLDENGSFVDNTFNENWENMDTIEHCDSGIIGDTVKTNVAEITINPWSDRREINLLENRNENERKLSKAERYFYGKYFLQYTVIPIIVYNYYWGAIMFFSESSLDDAMNFDFDLFRNTNKKAVYIVEGLREQFQALLLQVCLQNSYELILRGKSKFISDGKTEIEKLYPFWPNINYFENMDEITTHYNLGVDYQEYHDTNPDGSIYWLRTNNGKVTLRMKKIKNNYFVVIKFSYIKDEIPITLKSTIDLYLKEIGNIIELYESRINEEIAFCSLRAIKHFEDSHVLPPGKWEDMNRQIMDFIYKEISSNKNNFIVDENNIHRSKEKIFRESIDIAEKIINAHIKPINELITNVLDNSSQWYWEDEYKLNEDFVSKYCYDKYFIYPTGLFDLDNPPKNFIDINESEIRKIIQIKCEHDIKCNINQSLLRFILINLIRNTVTKAMSLPHPITSPGLIKAAKKINIELIKEETYINLKYWDDAEWDEKILNDKCILMNKYFTEPFRNDKKELNQTHMKGFAFRAMYLFLNKIPSGHKQIQFIIRNGSFLCQEFHIPIL